jgi:Fe(3+) dicitrate transport protein
MTLKGLKFGLMLSGLAVCAVPVYAQQAAEPAPPAAGDIPPVDVVQKPKAPTKKAVQAAPAKKSAPNSVAKKAPPPPAVEPVPQPPVVQAEPDGGSTPNAAQYPSGGQGAAARAYDGALSPVDASKGIVPGNLEKYPGAATRIDRAGIDDIRPRTTNDILERSPGVTIINDDGFARHGGIGLRGSPARRSRKVLVLEDGSPVNMSLYIDPSTHYIPPSDRIQSVEVLRGANAAYGPNNNHGVVNFVNLSPFGPNESEVEFSYGTGDSNTRHFHTRRTLGNVGVVASYSGANAEGTWDTERLRYDDFFGAIGWKGVDQDFVISAAYNRQRDDYDEANLEGEDDFAFGQVESQFYNQIGHCKTCFNPGSVFNTYNADIVRLQGVHNYYFDKDTTLTSRLYGSYHRRDRYQNFEGNPAAVESDEAGQPVFIDGDDVFVPEGSMLGRLRTYETYGADVRAEFANRAFFGGLRQDIQVGAKYEYNDFTNKNFFGVSGQILKDGDETGKYIFDRDYDAHGLSAFVQTVVHVTPELKVVPGVRVEHYRISRFTRALTEEEGEGEEIDDCLAEGTPIEGECTEIEGFSQPNNSESFDRTNVLPHLSFAWSGLHRSTIYGGYHQGLTMHVLREETIPPGEEVGDNFQLGIRSTAIRGLSFDLAGFYSMIDDYQIKGASTTPDGNNVFSTAEKVEIKGFEVEGRLESRPFTGGPWNFYSEGVYTYSHSTFDKAIATETDEDTGVTEFINVKWNWVPEVPRHVAALSLGVSHASGWDLSATYTYRGFFFTDEFNTAFGGDPEGEDGGVPSVWLLSARASYKIPNTGATVFVHGENLTDELYISDREDGIKPGQGRSVWGGLNIKF